MLAVTCDASSLRLRNDFPSPEPGPGEVLLRVRAVGICDTDLQLARGYMNFQGIPGHEFVAVDDRDRRVTAEINFACHNCPVCAAGRPGHCPNRTVLGIWNHHGAMAERVCVPERNVHPIPDGLDDLEAVFIEPLAAAFRIAEQVPLGPGCRLAVLGDGKLGLLCAWATRLTGAEVHLIGKHDEKLARAGAGIETHRLADAESLNRGFDVVVEATGSPSGLSTALTLVKPCGTVVLKTTVAAPHQLSLAPIVIDEVRVIGSRCGPFPVAIQALADRRIDVRPLIEAVYPLVQAERAFEHAARPGVRKILLRVDS